MSDPDETLRDSIEVTALSVRMTAEGREVYAERLADALLPIVSEAIRAASEKVLDEVYELADLVATPRTDEGEALYQQFFARQAVESEPVEPAQQTPSELYLETLRGMNPSPKLLRSIERVEAQPSMANAEMDVIRKALLDNIKAGHPHAPIYLEGNDHA